MISRNIIPKISLIGMAALAVGLAPKASAQAGTGFTISDTDVVFTQVNSPTSGTVTSVSGANLRFNGAAGTDHLFENWWWYRVDGVDTREFAFNNASGTSAGGNSATTSWTFSLFSASLNYVVVDTGLNTGTLTERMVVTNTSNNSIRLNLFNYVDFDVNGTAGTDSATLLGTDEMRITDGAWDIRYQGPGRTNYQVSAFATMRGLLTNTTVDDLNNTGLPFGPGDFTGGWQWGFDLAPGQQFTAVERLMSVPEPGTIAVLGIGVAAILRRRRK